MRNNAIKIIKGGSGVKIICADVLSGNAEKIRRDLNRNTVNAVRIWIDERRENSRTEGVASRSQLSAWSPDQLNPDKRI